jgi:trans-aconitate methyltransferase
MAHLYDDPAFLAGYVTLDRQVRGLDGAGEWPTLRAMVPDVAGRDVVDLGCGFGWFSRWASENGAASVLGIDVSTSMLARARAETSSPAVTYVRADLDVVELEPESADVVFSSLALHYVHDLVRLLTTVAAALVPGGALVFSVEHPIYSAPTSQEFVANEAGDRVWPLDNYLVEGERVRHWFVDGVAKHHRTIATYMNALVGAGLIIERIEEWGPTAEAVAAQPELVEDWHRPWFLLARATAPRR